MVNDAVAGGVAALSSCVLLQPLEVYKTRLQEQGRMPSSVSQYWRGTTATLIRNVPGVALYFTCLQHLRYLSIVFDRRIHNGILVDPKTQKMTAVGNLLSGGGARVLAGLVLMPLTVVKTMFESDRFKSIDGFFGMFKHVYKQDGFKGFFKGFSVTVLRDAPHAAIYVAIYEHTKTLINGHLDSLGTCAMAAIRAGTSATILTQPFDTIKTTIQLNKYDSVLMALRGIYSGDRGGVLGFYRGTMPRFMRKTLSSAITWTVYESLSGQSGAM